MHSEQDSAAPTFKRGFGLHPIGVRCDHSAEMLGPTAGLTSYPAVTGQVGRRRVFLMSQRAFLWRTMAAATLILGDIIDRVCNRPKGHSAIGVTSPAEYENGLTQTARVT